MTSLTTCCTSKRPMWQIWDSLFQTWNVTVHWRKRLSIWENLIKKYQIYCADRKKYVCTNIYISPNGSPNIILWPVPLGTMSIQAWATLPANWTVARMARCMSRISHSESFFSQKYPRVHVSVKTYCIVGYLSDTLCDLWDVFIVRPRGLVASRSTLYLNASCSYPGVNICHWQYY